MDKLSQSPSPYDTARSGAGTAFVSAHSNIDRLGLSAGGRDEASVMEFLDSTNAAPVSFTRRNPTPNEQINWAPHLSKDKLGALLEFKQTANHAEIAKMIEGMSLQERQFVWNYRDEAGNGLLGGLPKNTQNELLERIFNKEIFLALFPLLKNLHSGGIENISQFERILKGIEEQCHVGRSEVIFHYDAVAPRFKSDGQATPLVDYYSTVRILKAKVTDPGTLAAHRAEEWSKALKATDPNSRAQACNVLTQGDLGAFCTAHPDQFIPLFIEALLNKSSPWPGGAAHAQRMAAMALSHFGTAAESAGPALVAQLGASAKDYISQGSPNKSLHIMVDSLRMQAAMTLGEINYKLAIRSLMAVAQNDPSELVQSEAVTALGKLKASEAEPALRTLIQKFIAHPTRRGAEIAANAAWSIGEIGAQEEATNIALQDAMKSAHFRLSLNAEGALKTFRKQP